MLFSAHPNIHYRTVFSFILKSYLSKNSKSHAVQYDHKVEREPEEKGMIRITEMM